MAKMSFTTEASRRRIERIQELLRRECLSAPEIAEGIYMSVQWARVYVRHLHTIGAIHIAQWQRRKSKRIHLKVPLYAWGKSKDAPMPMESNAEYRRRVYHERRKHDPEAHDRYLAKQRAAKWEPKRDPLTAWIPQQHAHSTCDSAAVGM